MVFKRIGIISLFSSLLIHFVFLFYSPHIPINAREKLRIETEKIVQIHLGPSPVFISQEKEEKPSPKNFVNITLHKGLKLKKALSVPEPKTSMSEILPPLKKNFSQKVVSLSSKLLKEKIKIKPRRYISKEKGSSPFSNIGVKMEKGEELRFIPHEKIIPEEGERKQISSLPSLPSSITPLFALPSRKKYPYSFWDNLLNIEISRWKNYIKIEIGLKPNIKVNPIPKEVIFIVDSSKSIPLEKWDAFKEAVKKALHLLNPGDTFNIIVFRERIFPFRESPVYVSPVQIREASIFMDEFSPEGETDIYGALSPFLSKSNKRAREIFLFTDGRATAGVKSNQGLFSRITNFRNDVSLFTLGMGSKVNLWLLDLMAHEFRGNSFYRRYPGKFLKDFPKFFLKYRNPVLFRTSYRFFGAGNFYPLYLPNLYKEGKIILIGKINSGSNEIVFRMTGKTSKGEKEVVYRKLLSSIKKEDKNLPEIWARFRIYDILIKLIIERKKEYAEEIASLMEKYRIRLPYIEELWKKN